MVPTWDLSEQAWGGLSYCSWLLSMMKKDILALLGGGDRRTIGHADQVAAMVANDPELFPELIAGLWSEDPLVRMRAADAAEKVTRKHRELLQPYKKELLGLMTEAQEQELRWHLAVMVPRLLLNAKEQQAAMSSLHGYLEDRSSIVKTFALQGLADLAQAEPSFRPRVVEILRETTRKGTPAMKARSRKLLIHLGRI
jgi:alpha-beta hydrolase superfamily lysophospholipase